jgi:mannose-6-phosphate isomerase-like protein (cupin superfamily)
MSFNFKEEGVTSLRKEWLHMLERPRVMKKTLGTDESKAHTVIMLNSGILSFKKNMQPGAPSTFTHGHQYDALFYVLEGKGYEIHDGERYDWKAGDAFFPHPGGSVHQHYNADSERPARVLVFALAPAFHSMNLGADGLVELSESFSSGKDYQETLISREEVSD